MLNYLRRLLIILILSYTSMHNSLMNFLSLFLPISHFKFFTIKIRVSFYFGAITMMAGIAGVPLGSYLSTKLSKHYPRCDPVICAVGLLLSAPLIAASMIFVTYSAPLAYLCVFFGEVALNLNWAIVADMLLVRIYFSKFQSSSASIFLFFPWVFLSLKTV